MLHFLELVVILYDHKLGNFQIKRINLFKSDADETVSFFELLNSDKWESQDKDLILNHIQEISDYFKRYIKLSYFQNILDIIPDSFYAPVINKDEFKMRINEEDSAEYLSKMTKYYNIEHSCCDKAKLLGRVLSEDLELMLEDNLVLNKLSIPVAYDFTKRYVEDKIKSLKVIHNRETKILRIKRKLENIIPSYDFLYQKNVLYFSDECLNDSDKYIENIIGNYDIKNLIIVNLL